MVPNRNLVQRQRGQALMEVALSALLVLIPTFLIAWVLFSYGQARTTALGGARYAAWERTVWREKGAGVLRSKDEIENHMIDRIFGKPDQMVNSSYTSSSTNADIPSFYSMPDGSSSIDLERQADGMPPSGEATRPTLKLWDNGETTSSITEHYDRIVNFSSILGTSSGERLQDKGLYVAEVKMNLNSAKHLKVFEDLNLGITQRAAVVTDAWSAGGKAHEEAVVSPMVPASSLQKVTDWFAVLRQFSPFEEFKPGCVRGDVVPNDMLPPGTAQTNGVCQ